MPALRSRGDFARVSGEGRSRSDRLMLVRFVANGRDHDRFGISTGRRLGGAVRRNRVRRRVREILRQFPNETGHGWDILIVARPAAVDVSFAELSGTLQRMLSAIRSSVKSPS
ncbi:MAG: ribonuclease P protein component [Candidatus Limnocylindrales bacterium]